MSETLKPGATMGDLLESLARDVMRLEAERDGLKARIAELENVSETSLEPKELKILLECWKGKNGKLEAEVDALKMQNANMRLDLEWPLVKERDELKASMTEIRRICRSRTSAQAPILGLSACETEATRWVK